MWTYKNDYFAVMIIAFPTHKKDTNKYKNDFEEKVGMAVKTKLSHRSSSDGKLIQGDIPTLHFEVKQWLLLPSLLFLQFFLI